MKYNAATQLILMTICAFTLSACSGSGSGRGAEIAGFGGDIATGTISIAVTSPAGGNAMETPDESVILEGTAESNYEIVSVSWVNNRGGEGETSGTTSWKTTAIPLESGDNEVTVTAKDSSGATATHTVVIKKDSGATGSITLAWEAPTTREDGSPLTDLAGYRFKYGRMSEIYDYEIEIDNPGVLTYVVENLGPGTWYFAASAYDSNGLESDLSNEVAIVLP